MESYIQCPIDEKFCRREICLSNRKFPECENSVRLIVAINRSDKKLGILYKEDLLEAMIKAMANMLQVDKTLFRDRVQDAIQKDDQS